MLDTNAVSALMREPGGKVAQRIAASDETVSVSIIVAAELRYGAIRKGSARLSATVERILAALEIEPPLTPADERYGQLRARLEEGGMPMDANDLLIAAHALALDRTLVTGDQAFERVPGLRVENWVR